MNNREKMLHHIQRAEEAGLLLDELEAMAQREVTRAYGIRIADLKTGQEQENQRQLHLNDLLSKNIWYKKATGRRSLHMALAQMYGTAALVEITSDDQIPRS